MTRFTGCLDFGTSYSKAAVVEGDRNDEVEDEHVRVLPIADGVGLDPRLLPSVMFVDAGHLLFGQRAYDRAEALKDSRLPFTAPKQYLSQGQMADFGQGLSSAIDPTGTLSREAAVIIYVAYLIRRTRAALDASDADAGTVFRYTRPAWPDAYREEGAALLRRILERANRLAPRLDAVLTEADAASLPGTIEVLAKVRDGEPGALAFEPSGGGVTESAAAALSVKMPEYRHFTVVADIGGGTSDFGAFLRSLPRQDRDGEEIFNVAELRGTVDALPKAGRHLDMLLMSHILQRYGYVPGIPESQSVVAELQPVISGLKRDLFKDGRIITEIDDEPDEFTRDEFLDTAPVKAFANDLQAYFTRVTDAVRAASKDFGNSPIRVVLTGGGGRLPMVEHMARTDPNLGVGADIVPGGVLGAGGDVAASQLAVAVGGAMPQLPNQVGAIGARR